MALGPVYRSTLDDSGPTVFRVVEEYIHLDDWRPIAVVRPSDTSGMVNPDIHPILTDHLGTPRKVLDARTGQTRWDWDAKQPFGHQAPNETPTAGLPAFVFDLRFPGQRYDEATGLFQNGFRDYHAGLGRYVQSDPLGLGAGWNTYSYVSSNPLSMVDHLGLSEADVIRMRQKVNEAVSTWNRLGLRFEGFKPLSTKTNALLNNLFGYDVCLDQSDNLAPYLSGLELDDAWRIERKHGGWHHWIEATSSNPLDPTLIIDPWMNVVDEKRKLEVDSIYRTVDPKFKGWVIDDGIQTHDINGEEIRR